MFFKKLWKNCILYFMFIALKGVAQYGVLALKEFKRDEVCWKFINVKPKEQVTLLRYKCGKTPIKYPDTKEQSDFPIFWLHITCFY